MQPTLPSEKQAGNSNKSKLGIDFYMVLYSLFHLLLGHVHFLHIVHILRNIILISSL